jgi:prepilin-type N-terminal cleavage/methylation domain-containing protein
MRARSGFTLTEVLIAVSILTGALAGAAMLLTSAFGTYRHQNQTMEVFHVVHDQMETLTATSYKELTQDVKSGRRPEDPPRPGAGTKDFVTSATGDVTAKFDMVPEEKDATVYKIVPHRTDVVLQNGRRPPGEIEATLRLQWWDPRFDAPSATDKGLIRASFLVKGMGVRDQGVKYLTR